MHSRFIAAPHTRRGKALALSRRAVAGLVAGLAATLALSGVMLLTGAWLREPDVIHLLARLAGQMREPLDPAPRGVGWLAHFGIGVVLWGTLFAVLEPLLPAWRYALKGLVFGLVAGFAMIALFLPPLGYGLVWTRLGLSLELTALALNAGYGLVLGYVYGRLIAWMTRNEPQRR